MVWLFHLGTKNNNKNGENSGKDNLPDNVIARHENYISDIIKLQQHNLNNNDITLALAKNVGHKCFYRWMVFENASWLKSINPHTDCNFSLYSMVGHCWCRYWIQLSLQLNKWEPTLSARLEGCHVMYGLPEALWPLFVALLRFTVKNDTNDCKCVTSHSCYRYWVPKYEDWDDNSHRAFCISKNLLKQNKQPTLFSTTHQSSMNQSI